jgi:hypothetical protein
MAYMVYGKDIELLHETGAFLKITSDFKQETQGVFIMIEP